MSAMELFVSPFAIGGNKIERNLIMVTSRRVPAQHSFPVKACVERPSSLSVVWFRLGDLRTRDHPGLIGGCNAAKLAALLTIDELEPSDIAYIDLFSQTLRSRGTELFIRCGTNEAQLAAAFVEEVNADCVFVRADPTEETRMSTHRLRNRLGGKVALHEWRDEWRAWENDAWKMIPDEYPAFLKWSNRNSATPLAVPEEPPVFVPSPQEDISSISIAELSERVPRNQFQWEAFRRTYDEDCELAGLVNARFDEEDIDAFAERLVRTYLAASDSYSRVDLLRTLDPVFRLGLLSPARIYSIVHRYERENGRIWRAVFREGAKALLRYLDAREFAQLRARSMLDPPATVDGVHKARFWNWRGYLVRYVQEGDSARSAPPLVLIHGFGASSQHFSRSISILKKRFRVYAVDVIGYGQSEKPPANYTQDLWEYMIWEFIRVVVREPVYIAGNSIGGYFSASFAADAYPERCVGLVLLNSAGKIEDPNASEGTDANAVKKTSNPLAAVTFMFRYLLQESRPVRMLIANLIIRNLRRRIGKTLKLVYPTNPGRADEQLAREIYRNSLDFGATEVLASGFVLPPQRTLSELLQKYSGPLLVFQGVLDPLNSASDRVAKIAKAYPSATVVRSESGHCPHDEDAEGFAESVSEWMDAENEGRAARLDEVVPVLRKQGSSLPIV